MKRSLKKEVSLSQTPEIPSSLSPAAHAFLVKCFSRNLDERPTAASALHHPFLVQPDTISESTEALYSSQAPRRNVSDDIDDDYDVSNDHSSSVAVRGKWIDGNDISVGNNDDEDCGGSLDDLFY